MASSTDLRLASLLKWLGLMLVVLLGLQIIAVLVGLDWTQYAYQQLLIERMVSQSPMAFVGLMLMLIGSRLEHPRATRSVINWTVCALSSFLAVGMISVIPLGISGNRVLSVEANQALQRRRAQLENARQQGKNPESLQMLGEQLAQAGQLPSDVTTEDKIKAAQDFISGQLGQMDKQIKRAERQRDLAVNQRRFGGTMSVTVLAVGFLLLALAAVL
ncbi:hypothetical protein OMCYN_00744 [cyanobiont of Ornithocercus magnificus]|nr:hypothetical protein OMCYN_00744 [cyanobiont of Ornithocercus magnificus]